MLNVREEVPVDISADYPYSLIALREVQPRDQKGWHADKQRHYESHELGLEVHEETTLLGLEEGRGHSRDHEEHGNTALLEVPEQCVLPLLPDGIVSRLLGYRIYRINTVHTNDEQHAYGPYPVGMIQSLLLDWLSCLFHNTFQKVK